MKLLVGDKTGVDASGSDNEAAILWPLNRAPILVAAYLTQTPLPFEQTNSVHTRLARPHLRISVIGRASGLLSGSR
jgi:beta-lactamase class A